MNERMEKLSISLVTFLGCLISIIEKIHQGKLYPYDQTPYWLLASFILFILVAIKKYKYIPFGIIPATTFRLFTLISFFKFDPEAWPSDYIPVLILRRISGIIFIIGAVIFVMSYFNKKILKLAYLMGLIVIAFNILQIYLRSLGLDGVAAYASPWMCFCGYWFCYEASDENKNV